MDIKLNFQNHGHKDLILRIPEIGLEQIADTYYFSLDISNLTENETRKVVLNLIGLLQNWKDKLSKLQSNKIVFLPFDYSDEYLGGLRVEFIDDFFVFLFK
jgi:hypothetical protein